MIERWLTLLNFFKLLFGNCYSIIIRFLTVCMGGWDDQFCIVTTVPFSIIDKLKCLNNYCILYNTNIKTWSGVYINYHLKKKKETIDWCPGLICNANTVWCQENRSHKEIIKNNICRALKLEQRNWAVFCMWYCLVSQPFSNTLLLWFVSLWHCHHCHCQASPRARHHQCCCGLVERGFGKGKGSISCKVSVI